MRHVLYRQRSIPDVNYGKMNSKNIANMVNRLAKRFELDDESHPETILRQKVGALRYLVHKKYNERSIGNTLIYFICLLCVGLCERPRDRKRDKTYILTFY